MVDARPLVVAIGTYAGGGGLGLRMLLRDPAGTWSLGDVYPGARNASYGVHSSRFDLHYLVDERDGGAIGVHRPGPNGWERLASVSVDGDAPCHIALNHAQTQVATANYASGSVSVFAIEDATGLPRARAQVRRNRGNGPNRSRQDAPHAHWVGFSADDRWLYQTDLGTDQVLAFPVDRDGTLGERHIAYVAPAGSGPRHLTFHPHLHGLAYLACELSNTVTMLCVAGGVMSGGQTVTTLPAGWDGDTIVAQIATNRAGDRLYVSNRGHDSIAIFALDAAGVPSLIGHTATGQRSPRHFLLLEDHGCVIVSHEKDQIVTVLTLHDDGLLTPTDIAFPVAGAAYAFEVTWM